MRIGVKPGQWGWSFDELRSSWIAAEEAGFDVVSCFDHATTAPTGARAWDAPTLLAAMAGMTKRVTLAVDVLNVSLRPPFLLAAQLAVAQAASGGRLQVGLGAGSHYLARYDHEAIGVPFPSRVERLARLEACCRVFPRLWRGEVVTEATLHLDEASLGDQGIEPPPIFVGGQSDAILEIAATAGDGWNAGGSGVDVFSELAPRLDEACIRVGRDGPVAKACQPFVRDVGLDRAGDVVKRLEDAGADLVVFVLDEERGADWIGRLAEAAL